MIPSIAYGVWSVALFIKLLVFQELRYTPYMRDCFLTITLKNHLVFPVRFCKKKKSVYFWPCWVFVAAHSLILVAVSGGSSRVVTPRLLRAVPSLVAKHRLQGV